MARKKYKILSYNDRKRLEVMYINEESPSDIAAKLGVHIATVYKELERGNTGNLDKNLRYEYSADIAQRTITKSLKNRGRTLKKQSHNYNRAFKEIPHYADKRNSGTD